MNDLMSRARMADQGAQHSPAQHVPQTSNNKKKSLSPMKIVSAVLLIAVTILVVAMLAFLVFGGSKPEGELIKSDQYQAIFLNDQSGQVYFGKLTIVNSRLYRLTDIYYVRVENAVQPDRTGNGATQQNISLAKLGNELHGPEDEMFINRDQVLFWENLKNDGQVVTAITEFRNNGGNTNENNNTNNTNTNNGATGGQLNSGNTNTNNGTTNTNTNGTNNSQNTN